jgi:hypothetical protein
LKNSINEELIKPKAISSLLVKSKEEISKVDLLGYSCERIKIIHRDAREAAPHLCA